MRGKGQKSPSSRIDIVLAFLCVIMIGLIGGLLFCIKEKSKDLSQDAVHETESKEDRSRVEDAPYIERDIQESKPEHQEDDVDIVDENPQAEDSKAGAWKTEECYSRTENGESYLSFRTEYNSREDVTGKVVYNVDGSVKQESEFENEYDEDGRLVKVSEFCGGELLNWEQYEYDSEDRIIERECYDKDGRLMFEEPYIYEYDDEATEVLYCDHMMLTYNENGEYAGSGFSHHETYSYDEKGRMTAYYSFPLRAQCHMYDQTEDQIRQSLQEISLEAENPVFRRFAEMIDEYGEDASIEVYRYDANENLQEIDDYNAVTGELDQKTTCTYEYDRRGRIQKSIAESDSETVYVTYCYDAE